MSGLRERLDATSSACVRTEGEGKGLSQTSSHQPAPWEPLCQRSIRVRRQRTEQFQIVIVGRLRAERSLTNLDHPLRHDSPYSKGLFPPPPPCSVTHCNICTPLCRTAERLPHANQSGECIRADLQSVLPGLRYHLLAVSISSPWIEASLTLEHTGLNGAEIGQYNHRICLSNSNSCIITSRLSAQGCQYLTLTRCASRSKHISNPL